tara:strand:+ start:23886 stop:24005 length:120 start_codon:yes stop_codon:yes gene_type:complete
MYGRVGLVVYLNSLNIMFWLQLNIPVGWEYDKYKGNGGE